MINVSAGERVPLFNLLSLESSAVCNRSCVFCPNHQHERPDEYMSMELIQKAFDELGALKWKGSLNSFLYNEPMRDGRHLEIAQEARRLCPRATYMVSTNGDYLRGPESLVALFDAGVRAIHINIYSEWDLHEEKRERGVAAAARRYRMIEDWLDTIPGIERTNKIYAAAPRGARRVFLEAKFGATPGDTKIGQKFEVQNRSGNIAWMKAPLKEPLAKSCVRPFRNMNVNWRGDVLLCCNDYKGALKFGNIADMTLVEAWNSPMMNTYRLHLQNKRRDSPLCNTCDYSGGHYKHMIKQVTFGPEKDAILLAQSGYAAVKGARPEPA